MPDYFYTARTAEGGTETGTLSARSTYQLAQKLKEQNLILIKAVLEEQKRKKKFRIYLPFLRVSLSDKIMVVRNLQTMIGAGLSLVRSLDILANQAKSRKLRNALLDIKEEVGKGKNFSEGLSAYPDIFSEIFQSMVKVGEESGTLEQIFKTLSLQMEKEKDLKSKIRGALIYPTVIILTMVGIGVLMLVVIVPQLSEIFQELEVDLPFTTRLVINIGTIVSEKWYLVIVALFIIILVFWRVTKTQKGRQLIDSFFMKVPFISSIIKKSNSASIIRTLSSLTSSGVPVVRSLEIISNTLRNFYFKRAISEACETVEKGEKLSSTLQPHKNIFPYGTLEMIEVGEETGESTSILAKLADFFEEDVANTTKNLTVIIEPILMLVIGVVIGFFAISMLQPMYSLLSAL